MDVKFINRKHQSSAPQSHMVKHRANIFHREEQTKQDLTDMHTYVNYKGK